MRCPDPPSSVRIFGLCFCLCLCLGLLLPRPAQASTDFNGDGVDDIWQQYFNGWDLEPDEDEDQDGSSNLYESVAGTDPRNPADWLHVANVGASSEGSVTLTVATKAGKRYQLQSCDSPGGPVWADVDAPVTGTGGYVDFVAPLTGGAIRQFFRVQTQDQDTDSDGVSDWAESQMGTDPSQASSLSNAAGGTASDLAVLESLMSLSAAVSAPTSVSLEKEGSKARITLNRDPQKSAMRLTVAYSTSPNENPTKGSAAGADVTLTVSDPDGLVTGIETGTITIPAGASTMDILVAANQDNAPEVPELLTLNIIRPGTSAFTAPLAQSVMLKDASPVETENRTLFVAYLGREAGVTSTASGIATALVEGDNDGALVSLNFSNLSSEQNTAYVRIDSDLDILNVGIGQVSGKSWPIRAAQTRITDQAMLTALHNGEVYVAITTADNPTGELKGYFNRATGSTEFNPDNPDLEAPAYGSASWQQPTGEDLDRDIYRFLSQCTFGGTTAQHDEVLAEVNAAGGNIITGYTSWLNKQLDPGLTPPVDFSTLVMASDNEDFVMRGNKPRSYNSDPQYTNNTYAVTYDANGKPTISMTADTNRISNNYPNGAPNRRSEWWTMVLQAKDQVRQRMALALSEITVISDMDQTVNDQHYACAEYWDMLANGAFGKYRNLLEQVSYSPMMGIYLSHIGNRMQYDAGGGLLVSPDENYAREIMQLFSIGLVLRHPDGSLVLSTDGLPVSTYDQTDITELARVMTGWSHGARHSIATVPTWNGSTGVFANSQVRVSPVLEFNGSASGTNYTWFGLASGTHRFFPAPWTSPMKLIGKIGSTVYHDFNAKTLLAGKVGETSLPMQNVAGMTEAQSHAAAAAEMTLAHNVLAGSPSSDNGYDGHPNTPVNISRWLIQRLTTSNPSAGYIYRVSEAYRNSNGSLGEVVKAILLDYEARSLQYADTSITAGKVKEPLVQFAGILRALRAFSGAPLSNLRDYAPPFGASDSPLPGPYPGSEFNKFDTANINPPSLPVGWKPGPFRFRLGDTTGNFGQAPQRAPSVFNWFLPDFVVSGPMAQAGLYAPEMQIATESNEVAKLNYNYAYTWANIVGQSTQPGTDSNVRDFILTNNYATAAVRFNTGTVTFNSTNWNVPQTVTITAINNSILKGNFLGDIRFTTGGSTTTFNGVSVAPLPVTVVEDELVNEGVMVTPTAGNTWVQEGGKTDTFNVQLTAPPMAGAGVTVTMTAGSQVTLSASSLNFDSNTWNTPQTVTVTAVNDAATEAQGAGNDSIQFTTTSSAANYNGLTVPALAVSVLDNDDGASSYGVLITESGGGTDVNEAGGNDTYTVVLAKAPTSGTVTVRATSGTGLYMNSSGTSLTQDLSFSTSNWSTPQTFTVRANNDTTQESDHTVNITHSFTTTAGGYTTASVPIQPLTVNVTDDDNRLMLAHSDGETRVSEGGFTDTITVRLRTQPTANVTVNLGSGQVTCDPAVLTFTGGAGGNWATPQVVTVRAVDDITYEGLHSASIIAYSYSLDTNYLNYGNANNNLGAMLNCAILDDDLSRIIVTESGGSTLVSEADGTDTYTLALSQMPSADVGVAITAGTGISVFPTGPVVFTPENWNSPVTITVAATQDTTVEPETTVLISHAAVSADPRYNGISVGIVNPVISDNELPLTVAHTNSFTTVAEGGTAGTGGTPNVSDTFTVVLTRAPSAGNNVTVTLNPDPQITVSPATLTFTPSGAGIWSTAQTVTVTAVNDAAAEATPHKGTISFNIASNDAYYNGAAAPPVTVAVKDDDAPGVSIVEVGGNTLTTEGTGTDTYNVVLTKQPASDVVVRVAGDAQSEVLMSGSTYAATKDLTFTNANWSGAQTVTLRSVNDTVAELRHLSTISHSIVPASSADEYDAVTIAPVVHIITDNDNTVAANRVRITESSSSTTATEAGATPDTYSVVLSPAPTANVTVTLNNPDGQLTYSPATLTFTPANFATAQTVTVRAVDDTLMESSPHYGGGLPGANPHYGVLTHSATSADAGYNGVAVAPVTVSITDNDSPRVILVQSGGSTAVTEGSVTDAYSVVLSQAPAADVTVTIGANTQLTFAPAGPLTFTTENWNVPQAVTVTAVDDANTEASVHTAAVTHSVASTDPQFHGIAVPAFNAGIRDNDGPRIIVSHTGGSTSLMEGGAGNTDTITIVLSQAPAAGTTLDVNLIPPAYIVPVPQYSKQMGYFTNDLGGNQQKDRIVLDYTEVIQLYRSTFYGSLTTQYGGTIPGTPGSQQVMNAHWAATKAMVDRMDLWWIGGRLKAKYPDAGLVDRSQPAPANPPLPSPRQAILDAIFYINGGANSPGSTRYLAEVPYNPKAPVTGTFHDEIRDRARWAAYLVSGSAPGLVSH